MPVILLSFGYAVTPFDGLEAEAVIGHFDQLAASAALLLNPKDRRHARS